MLCVFRNGEGYILTPLFPSCSASKREFYPSQINPRFVRQLSTKLSRAVQFAWMQRLIRTFVAMLVMSATMLLGLGFYAQHTAARLSRHTAQVLRENYDSITFMDQVVVVLAQEERLVLYELAAPQNSAVATVRHNKLTGELEQLDTKLNEALRRQSLNITLPDEGEATQRLLAACKQYQLQLFAATDALKNSAPTRESTGSAVLLTQSGAPIESAREAAESAANQIRRMNHDWMEQVAGKQARSAPRYIITGTIAAVVALLLMGLQLARRLQSQAREFQALRTHFVAIASHELRTPVTSLKMGMDLLAAGTVGPLNPEQRTIAEAGIDDCDRLLALSRQLLDVTKIQSGQLEMRPVAVDVRLILSDSIKALRRTLDEKQVTVHTQLELPENTRAHVDPTKAVWVLTNLLSNAVRYSPAGGQIRVFARRSDTQWRAEKQVTVSVSDTGPGIPREVSRKIFRAYCQGSEQSDGERANEESVTANVGLGLAIAQEIVTAHGGRIWVEPAPERGQGATVTFTLPLARDGE